MDLKRRGKAMGVGHREPGGQQLSASADAAMLGKYRDIDEMRACGPPGDPSMPDRRAIAGHDSVHRVGMRPVVRGALKLRLLHKHRVGKKALHRRAGNGAGDQKFGVGWYARAALKVIGARAKGGIEGGGGVGFQMAQRSPLLSRDPPVDCAEFPTRVGDMTTELIPRPMVIEEFEPHVGKLFRLDCEPRNVDITLVSATPLTNHRPSMRPPFLLMFHSDPMVQLGTGIYAMRSGSFGPDMVYIEQTMPPPDAVPGHYYQAVFN